MKIDNLTYLNATDSLSLIKKPLQERKIDVEIKKENMNEVLSNYNIKGIYKDNEWYYAKCDLKYLLSYLEHEELYQKIEYAGAIGVDFNNQDIKGKILDIGGGGEAIIGQYKGDSVVSIDPNKRELEEAPHGALKIIMDASELKFIDQTFDTATSFFTLMYIPKNIHKKVLEELHRVLKPNGEFHLWDINIPKEHNNKKLYASSLEITLPHKEVFTGYGIEWVDKEQDLNYYINLAKEVGFELINSNNINDIAYYAKFKKSE